MNYYELNIETLVKKIKLGFILLTFIYFLSWLDKSKKMNVFGWVSKLTPRMHASYTAVHVVP